MATLISLVGLVAGTSAIPAGAANAAVARALRATTTAVTVSPKAIAPGGAATLSATVRSSSGTPAGSVSFSAGTTHLCTAQLASGLGHCSANFATPGTYKITGKYGGSATYAGSQGSVSLAVRYATATVVSISPATVDPAGQATLSATVSSAAGIPGGTVVFSTGGTTLCSATLYTAQASCAASFPLGTYSVTGAYSGDVTHSGSSGTASVVSKYGTGTSVTASPTTINAGGTSTLTATVTSGAGRPPATGTVAFSTGGAALCTATLSAGNASCAATFGGPGSYTVTGTYGGDASHQGSSNYTSVTVNRIPMTSALVACVVVGDNDKEWQTPIRLSLTLSNGTVVVPITGDLSNSTYYPQNYTNCGSGQWVLPLTQAIPTSELTGATFTVLAPGRSWHGQFRVWARDQTTGVDIPALQTVSNMYYNDTGNLDPCSQYIGSAYSEYSFTIPQITGYWDGPSCGTDPGSQFDFASNASGRYVSAELGYSGATYGEVRAATYTSSPNQWTVVSLGASLVALRDDANGLFASAEIGYAGNYYGMLRARASMIGPWEEYFFVVNSDASVSLRANANGDYVSTELGYQGSDYAMLRARATAIGPWEKYTWYKEENP